MSKHFTIKQWSRLFKLYETKPDKCWKEFAKLRTFKKSSKIYFEKKYREFVRHNKDMNTIFCKNNKSSKGRGRPKKTYDRVTVWKKIINHMTDDQIAELIIDISDITGEKAVKERIDKEIKAVSLSSREAAVVMKISKSKVCYMRKPDYQPPKPRPKNILLRDLIKKILVKNRFQIGRGIVADYLLRDYGVSMSVRQVGRIMVENGWKASIRAHRRTKELKNVNYVCPNLVERDYDNVRHDLDIYASDVTYLPPTKDCNTRNVYLSIVISHRTKEVVGWSLSKFNDTQLILDSFKNITDDFKGSIIHTDHGVVYSSHSYLEMLKENECIQSMSRVGNSLDNRVAEFWFSILKTELIRNLNVSRMTLAELEFAIQDYMNYYNNTRIQKKLGSLAPTKYKKMLSSN